MTLRSQVTTITFRTQMDAMSLIDASGDEPSNHLYPCGYALYLGKHTGGNGSSVLKSHENHRFLSDDRRSTWRRRAPAIWHGYYCAKDARQVYTVYRKATSLTRRMAALTGSIRMGHGAHSQGDVATVTCQILRLRSRIKWWMLRTYAIQGKWVRLLEEDYPSQRCE